MLRLIFIGFLLVVGLKGAFAVADFAQRAHDARVTILKGAQ